MSRMIELQDDELAFVIQRRNGASVHRLYAGGQSIGLVQRLEVVAVPGRADVTVALAGRDPEGPEDLRLKADEYARALARVPGVTVVDG